MIKIYNADKINENSKFLKTLILGIPFSIFVAFVYSSIEVFFGISFSFTLCIIGLIIGLFVKNIGTGVSTKFGILGATLTIVAIILAGIFPILINLGISALPTTIIFYFSSLLNFSSVLRWVYIALAVFLAFNISKTI
ncbi:MAG: hypothetical protein ACK5G7_06020 [Erysipelotrichaceae bacterium]